MLGRLARWLRILGYDTLYNPNFSDDDLFFKAHQEKRVLLTRDLQLARRMNPNYCFFVTEHLVRDQVRQVVSNFNLDFKDHIFTRCTLCNEVVTLMPKSSVKDKVPDFVYQNIEEFYYCKICDKIYWAGSHIKQVRDLLSKFMPGKK